MYAQAIAELKAAGYTSKNGYFTVRVKGASINFPDPAVVPNFGTGGSGATKYVWLSRDDQQAIVAGAAAGIIGGLCLLGPAVCIVAGVIVAVASVYLNSAGTCPTSSPYLRIRIIYPKVLGCYSRK